MPIDLISTMYPSRTMIVGSAIAPSSCPQIRWSRASRGTSMYSQMCTTPVTMHRPAMMFGSKH